MVRRIFSGIFRWILSVGGKRNIPKMSVWKMQSRLIYRRHHGRQNSRTFWSKSTSRWYSGRHRCLHYQTKINRLWIGVGAGVAGKTLCALRLFKPGAYVFDNMYPAHFTSILDRLLISYIQLVKSIGRNKESKNMKLRGLKFERWARTCSDLFSYWYLKVP